MSFPFVQPYFGLGNSLQTAQAGGAGGIGGWVELGRTTLGSANASIDVSSLPDKRYYMVLNDLRNTSTNNGYYRIDNDSGSNYAARRSDNGGADGTDVNWTVGGWTGTTGSGTNQFGIMYLSNVATKEKLFQYLNVSEATAGAGTAPNRSEGVSKHVQTTNPIDAFNIDNLSSTYKTNSETVVLGWDPADTHTTNFWEEIGTGTGTGVEDVTASASKKYNWIQGWVNPTSGSTSMNLQLGNGSLDTGTNYSWRYSLNGAGDVTTGSDSTCVLYGTGADTSIHLFYNIFFINVSANEKLIMIHNTYYDTAGAGSAPNRFEIAGKWANTSAQANHAGIVFSAGNAASNSELRWWGSD